MRVGLRRRGAVEPHPDVVRLTPEDHRYLTSFYMWMSAGGVIGGISAGLLAPYVFNWVAEYPILLAMSVLCRPALALPKPRIWEASLLGTVVLAALGLVAISTFWPKLKVPPRFGSPAGLAAD